MVLTAKALIIGLFLFAASFLNEDIVMMASSGL